jgi:hypothetical protein
MEGEGLRRFSGHSQGQWDLLADVASHGHLAPRGWGSGERWVGEQRMGDEWVHICPQLIYAVDVRNRCLEFSTFYVHNIVVHDSLSTIWLSTILFSTILFSTILLSTILCTIWLSAILLSTMVHNLAHSFPQYWPQFWPLAPCRHRLILSPQIPPLKPFAISISSAILTHPLENWSITNRKPCNGINKKIPSNITKTWTAYIRCTINLLICSSHNNSSNVNTT